LEHQAEKGVRAVAHLARQDPIRKSLFAALARLIPVLEVQPVIQVPEDIRYPYIIRLRHGTMMPNSTAIRRTLFPEPGLSTKRGVPGMDGLRRRGPFHQIEARLIWRPKLHCQGRKSAGAVFGRLVHPNSAEYSTDREYPCGSSFPKLKSRPARLSTRLVLPLSSGTEP